MLVLLGAACTSKTPSSTGDPTPPGGSGGTSPMGPMTGGAAGGSTVTGGTGTGGSGGAGAGSGGSSGSPLPPAVLGITELVFERRLPRGTRAGDHVAHIYAMDVNSRTERLLSNLDDDGQRTGALHGLAVSPDRRRIAFASKAFRATAEDSKFGFSSGAIWAVDASGNDFQRLTPPYDSQVRDAGPCTRDSDCAELYTCQMARCVRATFGMGYSAPVFSSDGTKVFFREAWSWFDERGGTINAVFLQSWVRIASGARPTDLGLPSCKGQQPLARHPSTGSLLIFRATCAGPQTDPSWFTEWTPDGTHRAVHRDDTGRIPLTQDNLPYAAWLPDGSGFYYVSVGEPNSKGNPRSSKQGLSLWTASGGGKSVYAPGADSTDVDGVTVMGNGTVIVELARFAGATDTHDLYQLDPQSGQATTQLTQGGNNHHPTW
jgi:hypothetical protein